MKFFLNHLRLVKVLIASITLGWMLIGNAKVSLNSDAILIIGDSLSAEYGLERGTGWVALLQKKLIMLGKTTKVINASISGDTTAGGRIRLSSLINLPRR